MTRIPTQEHDRLVFHFPQIEAQAKFAIEFERSLRIPDSDQDYALPPGLGGFPLRHVEDCAQRLPKATASRGGVMMPMWEAGAMWLDFSGNGPGWDLDLPVAVNVAAGKINAVTGELWRAGLGRP